MTSGIAEIITSTGSTELPFFDLNGNLLSWKPSINLTMCPKSGVWPEGENPREYVWDVSPDTWSVTGSTNKCVLTPSSAASLTDKEVTVTCTAGGVYGASTTLIPSKLDLSTSLKIESSETDYISCYLPGNEELD